MEFYLLPLFEEFSLKPIYLLFLQISEKSISKIVVYNIDYCQLYYLYAINWSSTVLVR